MEDYESVLCVKSEVFVYRIPARTSNRGYRCVSHQCMFVGSTEVIGKMLGSGIPVWQTGNW